MHHSLMLSREQINPHEVIMKDNRKKETGRDIDIQYATKSTHIIGAYGRLRRGGILVACRLTVARYAVSAPGMHELSLKSTSIVEGQELA